MLRMAYISIYKLCIESAAPNTMTPSPLQGIASRGATVLISACRSRATFVRVPGMTPIAQAHAQTSRGATPGVILPSCHFAHAKYICPNPQGVYTLRMPCAHGTPLLHAV